MSSSLTTYTYTSSLNHLVLRILRQEGHADLFVLRSWSPELDFDEDDYSPEFPHETEHIDIVNVNIHMDDRPYET